MTSRLASLSPGSVGRHSFSLVELLVAITILSILVIVLVGMLDSVLTTWQAGRAHNERRAVAQTVLNRMTRDIYQAGRPVSHNLISGTVGPNTLEMIINPSGVSSANKYPQNIFWQAPVATDGGTYGNMAIVGYFVQWVPNGGAVGTPSLCRVLINPSAGSPASSDYGVFTGSPSPWISDALLQKYASATAANNYAGLLAANVIGLWVQALDPNGNPIDQGISSPDIKGEAYDSKYSYSYTNFSVHGSPLQTNLASALPARLQIAVAVIDSQTALHLTTNFTAYPLTGDFWGDIQTFYNALPAAIQKGTEIQTTSVPLAESTR